MSVVVTVAGTYGPMTVDVDSCTLVMRALWDGYMFQIDPDVAPIKFDEKVLEISNVLICTVL